VFQCLARPDAVPASGVFGVEFDERVTLHVGPVEHEHSLADGTASSFGEADKTRQDKGA
jgi:hypothetical protein